MNCDLVEPDLVAYLDDELPSGRREEIREHLDACTACANRLSFLNRTSRVLSHALEAPAPTSTSRSYWGILAMAASMLFCLGLLWMVLTPPAQENVVAGGGQEEWIEKLDSPDIRVRTDAEAELIKLGEKAIPLLEKAAKNGNSEIRSRALKILDQIRTDLAMKGEAGNRKRWETYFKDLKRGMNSNQVRRLVEDAVGFVSSSRGSYRNSENNLMLYERYALDGDWALFILLSGHGKYAVGSHEIVGSSEMREEIGDDLYPYVRMVHRAPSISGSYFDPVSLVRAVNGLQKLDKKKALRVMERYLEVFDQKYDLQTRYGYDEQRVFLVLRLLFERNDGDAVMPRMVIGAPDFPGVETVADKDWPLFPLALVDDLPLLIPNGYMLGGKAQSPREHIDYFRRNGKIRAKPLKPGRPLDILDTWLASAPLRAAFAKKDSGKDWYTGMFRGQILRAVRSMVPYKDLQIFDDPKWAPHEKRLRELKPLWDADKQTYVRS